MTNEHDSKCVVPDETRVEEDTSFSTVNRGSERAERPPVKIACWLVNKARLQKGSERFNISESLRRRSTGKIQNQGVSILSTWPTVACLHLAEVPIQVTGNV